MTPPFHRTIRSPRSAPRFWRTAAWAAIPAAVLTTFAACTPAAYREQSDRRAYRIIDGRESVKGHGAPNMPVWGSNFLLEGLAEFAYHTDMPNDLDVHVRNRILSLIDYLNRIQVK